MLLGKQEEEEEGKGEGEGEGEGEVRGKGSPPSAAMFGDRSILDFSDGYTPSRNLNSPSKLTFLDFHKSKVLGLPCISCSLTDFPLANPKLRTALIIICERYMDKNIVSRLKCMQVPEPARSSVGTKTLLDVEEKTECDSSEQQPSIMECDVINKEGDVDTTRHSLTAHTTIAVERNNRKISLRKCKRTDKSIRLEDLQQHFGKRRKEAAKSLKVSVSTLKRIARQHGIPIWPYSKINKSKAFSQTSFGTSRPGDACDCTLLGLASLNGCKHHNTRRLDARVSMKTERPIQKIPESNQADLPSCETRPKELAATTTDVQTSPLETPMQDLRTTAAKVTFGNDIIRFELSSSSKMVDLEEEVAKRLKLKVGSFNVRYLDEDSDWVLIACDADLWYCMRLLGSTTIKMVVLPIIN